ncbi:neurofilament medium polypeptide [Etheostoma spectabile]|uniref:neurofilament medium polypeptide n=1 Tax=Etheostoma spectabile TaxID=54343 RepID=UPI0013AF1CF9|nr:neurofilament medium polypeptide-like [Etheostoma spectabile]
MAATEANAAPVVQEDGKTPESKPAEAEQPANNANTNSETANSEVVDKDGSAVNSEVVDNKETVNNDTAAGAEDGDAAAAASEEAAAAPPQNSENASSAEPKTSFLDSFLNKSGLGKVMGGRKKKESITATTGGEENAVEGGGEKEGEKGGEEAAAPEGGAEGGTDGEATIEKAENGEKEEEKKAEKGKPAEAKSMVRDLIRKPVARIFSHRSTEKKDVKVRSKSLDRLDPEALNAAADSTAEEGGATEAAAAAAGGADEGEEGEQKAASSSATTKHMKRWHSFKKLMAQKGHKKSAGEDVKEEDGEGGGDSSTLDSKESGQKRWKLKRSWTFQGLKRDPSVVGISGKAKGSDKDSADNAKPEEEVAAAVAAAAEEAVEGEEAKEEGGTEEAKAEGGEEKEKAEGGEEEKAAAAAGSGGTVTQHANEIWTSFKKRVIPKSKRANTECAPSGEEDATSANTETEDGDGEEGKDAKAAKAKRSHFGRAVSLKNFILRKGKSTSVDMGEGAKEEEEEEEGAAAEGGEAGDAAKEGTADGDANDKDATEAEKTPAAPEAGGDAAAKVEAEKTPADAPVTNGENGCSNGTGDENATHNHQDDGDEDAGKTPGGGSPVKKGKESGGAKEEANAKIINTTAAVNSDKKAGNV